MIRTSVLASKTEHSSADAETVEMRVNLHKLYVVEDARDALQLTVTDGHMLQGALAENVTRDLRELGYDVSIKPSTFSDLINNPQSQLYKYLMMIRSIMKHANSDWLLEYLAAERGKQLVDKPEGGAR